MNKKSLVRRTARAEVIRNRFNPPYRIVIAAPLPGGPTTIPAVTREAARNAKRELPGSVIEQRVSDGLVTRYARIR